MLKLILLGFEIFEKYSDEKETIENFYTFIKIDKTFAFTKKKYYWTSNNEKDNFEYESSGRCIKISKNEFDAEKKIKKVVKKENKNLNDKTDKNSNFSNIIKGQKTIAITWDGYEELILGKIVGEKILLVDLNLNCQTMMGSASEHMLYLKLKELGLFIVKR